MENLNFLVISQHWIKENYSKHGLAHLRQHCLIFVEGFYVETGYILWVTVESHGVEFTAQN